MTAATRTANVLGALALVVTDQTDRAVATRSGQSESSAAALSALQEFLDQPTVDKIRRVLGLTPSGAVRLVDRLVDAGLVTRGPGADGRSRAISLTTEGRRAAAEVAAARAGVLADMTDGLTDDEFDSLHRLLSKVMGNAVRTKSRGAWICRMCDLAACERNLGHCPAAEAARIVHSAESAAQSAAAWNHRVDALETEVARTRNDRSRTPRGPDVRGIHTTEDTA
jgi:DNA-binding MarR family transcriptional regulator